MNVHDFMVTLSDVTIVVLVACLVAFALDARRARHRNGPAIRRFFDLAIALVIFFTSFAFMYVDKRFELVPATWKAYPYLPTRYMGYEWYWTFRLMLLVAVTRLWWALRR